MDCVSSINQSAICRQDNNNSEVTENYRLVSDILNKYNISVNNEDYRQFSPDMVIDTFCRKNNIIIDRQKLDDNISHIRGITGDTISLKSLLMIVGASNQYNDMVSEILSGMNNSVESTREARDNIKEELHELAIELKIFSIIQSQLNKTLSSANQEINIDNNGQNLLDPALYGMTAAEFNGPPPSKEKVFLDKIAGKETGPGDILSIKDFLQSDKKSSPAMSGLENKYVYDKNNNKLGHFAGMVGDVSRPLNDMVNEKSTQLNEISNIYNSSIEALTRFIQKLDTLLQDLSGSI
ncbi:virulence-associated V antigen [Morganella morganii]|uniref:virulence-associated V antigen n=1 Tax=Morganella morganii TaxID=582 RepID=UPI003EBFB355